MVTKKSDNVVAPLQAALLVETWQNAVDAIAMRMGGRKALALDMWPTKGDQAEKWLDDCLNNGRKAKLGPQEIFYLLRKGHELGVHTLMAFIADDAGYTRPQAITASDRQAELHQTVVRATEVLDRAVKELKTINDRKR